MGLQTYAKFHENRLHSQKNGNEKSLQKQELSLTTGISRIFVLSLYILIRLENAQLRKFGVGGYYKWEDRRVQRMKTSKSC